MYSEQNRTYFLMGLLSSFDMVVSVHSDSWPWQQVVRKAISAMRRRNRCRRVVIGSALMRRRRHVLEERTDLEAVSDPLGWRYLDSCRKNLPTRFPDSYQWRTNTVDIRSFLNLQLSNNSKLRTTCTRSTFSMVSICPTIPQLGLIWRGFCIHICLAIQQLGLIWTRK